jgi:hypothetical protein
MSQENPSQEEVVPTTEEEAIAPMPDSAQEAIETATTQEDAEAMARLHDELAESFMSPTEKIASNMRNMAYDEAVAMYGEAKVKQMIEEHPELRYDERVTEDATGRTRTATVFAREGQRNELYEQTEIDPTLSGKLSGLRKGTATMGRSLGDMSGAENVVVSEDLVRSMGRSLDAHNAKSGFDELAPVAKLADSESMLKRAEESASEVKTNPTFADKLKKFFGS